MVGALTIPATVSLTTTAVVVLFGLLAMGFSSARGYRDLRWFAVCASAAAVYTACSVVVTLPAIPGGVLAWASRISLCAGGVHGAAWFRYVSVQQGRPTNRFEWFMIWTGLAFAVTALVPGLVITDTLAVRHVTWLGVTYRDMLPSPFGLLCLSFYQFGILALCVFYARQWWRRKPWAAGHAIGFLVLFAASVNDGLAVANIIQAPYFLDVGFLGVVAAIGVSVAGRFLADAAELASATGQLRRTQEQLVQRERLAAIGEVAAVVAHEVRNPLCVIFNAVAGLRHEETANADRAALLVVLKEEAERLNRTVAALLDFARPFQVKRVSTPVASLVSSAIEAAEHQADRPDVRVEMSVDPAMPDVQLDPDLVRQALVNLLVNAMQAVGPDGIVRCGASLGDDGALRVEVSDDGAGIPADLSERVFAPFFTTRATGTGLGLSLVRRIAEAHGGTVSLMRGDKPGATFGLSLPK